VVFVLFFTITCGVDADAWIVTRLTDTKTENQTTAANYLSDDPSLSKPLYHHPLLVAGHIPPTFVRNLKPGLGVSTEHMRISAREHLGTHCRQTHKQSSHINTRSHTKLASSFHSWSKRQHGSESPNHRQSRGFPAACLFEEGAGGTVIGYDRHIIIQGGYFCHGEDFEQAYTVHVSHFLSRKGMCQSHFATRFGDFATRRSDFATFLSSSRKSR
jgi:hypothetical protein